MTSPNNPPVKITWPALLHGLSGVTLAAIGFIGASLLGEMKAQGSSIAVMEKSVLRLETLFSVRVVPGIERNMELLDDHDARIRKLGG